MKANLVLFLVLAAGQVDGQARSPARIKPYTMQYLFLLTVTGDEPKNGLACRVGAQMAFDEANANQAVLPGYHLEPIYEDERLLSSQAVPLAMRFYRQRLDWLENPPTTPIYHSPILYGPYFSIGCGALARTAPFLGMVHISLGCVSPIFTGNRVKYPNLYRIKISGEMVAYPQLYFMRRIGKWNRFALLTFSTNYQFDLMLGLYLLKAAPLEGFEVAFFDIVPDIDDGAILRLKSTDARVAVLSTATTMLMLKFLCFTHKHGMTGSRYAFIVHTATWAEPPSIPRTLPNLPYCTKEVILEQYKYTFWAGFAMTATDQRPETVKSSLGSTMADFEAKFDNLTNGQPVADYDKRMNCYDSTVHSIMALDDAEKKLVLRNMSLRNYATNPDEIMQVVNNSMATIAYDGFRVGHFKYSSRAEFDGDTQIIFQWTPEKQLQVLYEFVAINESNLGNYSNYLMRSINPPIWYTQDKKPPNDRSKYAASLYAVPTEFFWAIVAIGSLVTSLQTGCFVMAVVKNAKPFPIGLACATFGCILLNVVAIIFAVRVTPGVATNSSLCVVQRVLCAIALGLVHGYIVMRNVTFLRFKIVHGHSASGATSQRSSQGGSRRSLKGTAKSATAASTKQQSVSSVAVNRSTRHSSDHGDAPAHGTTTLSVPAGFQLKTNENLEKPVIIGLSGVMAVTAVYCIIWMSVDAPTFFLQTSAAIYDFESDTVTADQVFTCKSDFNDAAWVGALVAAHVALLVVGALLSFKLRRVHGMLAYFPDFTIVKSLTGLVGTLLFAAILLIIVLRSPVSDMIVLACICILISICTAIAIYIPTLKSASLRRVGA